MSPLSLAERRLQPRADVIDVLEDVLQRARAGEVRGVAVACACDGGHDATTYAIGDMGIAPIVLAVERVRLRLLTEGEVVDG